MLVSIKAPIFASSPRILKPLARQELRTLTKLMRFGILGLEFRILGIGIEV